MAAPNMIAFNSFYGLTTGANLTTTSATVVLSNPANSGHCYKVNTLNVSNYTATAATITIAWYNAPSLGGSSFPIAGNVTVPAYSTLNVIDKSSQYYISESASLGATAGTANALVVTASYEDIS